MKQLQQNIIKIYDGKINEVITNLNITDLNIDEILKETNLEKNELKQLEEWTNKKCSEVIFDSNKDDWSTNTSVFDSKIKNKSNLVFIVEEENNNKFGYYFNGTVNTNGSDMKAQGSFMFTLKSNGRINGMYKFEEKSNVSGLQLYQKSSGYLFYAHAGIEIYSQNNKTSSHVYEFSSYFDFHGTSKAFHPNCINDSNTPNFTPKRFTVIQMN